ncbi:MAG: peptide ABC transporter substrate-binding protein [Sporichthyaceae bacterium]
MRVRRVRGYRAVGAGVAAVLVLSACGGGGGGDVAAPPAAGGGATGEISVQGCKPQNPLIPTNTNETCGGDIIDQVAAKLIRYKSDTGESINDIAESVETKDSKLFTITIKRGVKFSDGTEVKAANYVDAWNFGANGANAQLNSYFFEPIKGYEELQKKDVAKTATLSGLKKVDDYTFTVETAQAYSPFPRRLGYSAFSALPDSFFKDDGKAYGTNPVGAGPFKLVSADPSREFVLEADPNYDRGPKPSVQKVTFRVYDKVDAAYNDLLANNVDLIHEIPTDLLASGQFEQDLGDRKIDKVSGRFSSISVPSVKSGDKSFENAKLRQAISMAIDRPLIAKTIFFDTVTPATGWVSPAVGGYKADACQVYCTYNKDQAKRLFDEAGGHKSGPITLSYNADASHQAWVEAACNQIKEALAVDCLPKPVPLFASFRETISKKQMTGLFRTGWQMDYPYIENFLAPLYATGAGSNDGDYSNKAFDAKLKEAAKQTDAAAVDAAYQEAERMLALDMPVIPLWYPKTTGGHSSKIASAAFTVFGTYDFTSIVLK